jgi:prevent-host-death family protein
MQDAKARFSELVRLAREAGPQRVTVRGRDAVVIMSSDDYDRMCNGGTGAALVETMADPRVRDLDFEHARNRPPVRDVKL